MINSAQLNLNNTTMRIYCKFRMLMDRTKCYK